MASIQLNDVDEYAVIGFGHGHLWAHLPYVGTGKLLRIDPGANRVTDTTDLGDPTVGNSEGRGTLNLVFADDSVFTCDTSRTITQVDAVTALVEEVRTPPFDCPYIGVGAGSLWISSYPTNDDPQSARIDLRQ